MEHRWDGSDRTGTDRSLLPEIHNYQIRVGARAAKRRQEGHRSQGYGDNLLPITYHDL